MLSKDYGNLYNYKKHKKKSVNKNFDLSKIKTLVCRNENFFWLPSSARKLECQRNYQKQYNKSVSLSTSMGYLRGGGVQGYWIPPKPRKY